MEPSPVEEPAAKKIKVEADDSCDSEPTSIPPSPSCLLDNEADASVASINGDDDYDEEDTVFPGYDDEDLNEDALTWLDRNYDRSRAARGCSSAGTVSFGSGAESVIDADGSEAKGSDDSSTAAVTQPRRLTYEKTVLVERTKRFKSFNVLPDGWVAVTHDSGMPVYLHKELRVCTLSMPYFLGPGSVRKHDIPIAAVPCLEYRRANVANDQAISCADAVASSSSDIAIDIRGAAAVPPQDGMDCASADADGGSASCPFAGMMSATSSVPQPKAQIEMAGDMVKSTSLSAGELHDYCKSLFEFTKIPVEKFPSWKERREHTRKHRPQMPVDATLITFRAADLPEEFRGAGVIKKTDLILNPKGKTFVCILHEYLQWAMKTKPTYTYQETDNSSNPYCAVVKIGDVAYGTGIGANKKNAKSDAAHKTLAVLLKTECVKAIEARASSLENAKSVRQPMDEDDVASYFDTVKIDDTRLSDLCQKAGLLLPYGFLLECLKRNFMMGDTDVKIDSNVISTGKVEVTLTVSKYTATVTSKNKKLGKQLASQFIMKKLHPHITCWGSIVRLYYNGCAATVNERKVLPSSNSDTDEEQLESRCTSQQLQQESHGLAVEGAVDAVVTLPASSVGASILVSPVCGGSAKPTGQCSQVYPSFNGPPSTDRSVSSEATVAEPIARTALPDVTNSVGTVGALQQHTIACQTSWYGYTMLHKATQHPDMTYSPFTNKNIVRSSTAGNGDVSVLVPPDGLAGGTGGVVVRCSTASQTDPVGHAALHKATQHPDVAYFASGEVGIGEQCSLAMCVPGTRTALPPPPPCWPAPAFGHGQATSAAGGIPTMMGAGCLQPPPSHPFGSTALPPPSPQYGLPFGHQPYYVDPASYPMPVYAAAGYGPLFHGLQPPLPYDY